MYHNIEYILGMRFCKPVFHGMALRLLNIRHRKRSLLGFFDESSSGPSDTRLGRWRMERIMGQGLVNMWAWVKNHRLLSILSIDHSIFWVLNFDLYTYMRLVYTQGKLWLIIRILGIIFAAKITWRLSQSMKGNLVLNRPACSDDTGFWTVLKWNYE